MPILTGALIVGTGLQVYGNMRSASAQRRQAAAEARIREAEARETERRFLADVETTKRTGAVFLGQQAAAFASAGIDVGSGVALTMMEETARQFAEKVTDIRLEGEFRARNIRQGAALNAAVREDQARAHEIAAVGTILNFAGGLAK